MGDRSKIEWTDATWNPIRARNRATGKVGHYCVHVSEGCRNCYAERLQKRFGNPVRYAAQDRDQVELFRDFGTLSDPIRWKRPRMIFVCSMTDLFGEFVPEYWIDDVFTVMALCPQHTFQVLTKRPERARDYLSNLTAKQLANAIEGPSNLLNFSKHKADAFLDPDATPEHRRLYRAEQVTLPLPNVWLGTSVEDQATANERIPHLLQTPAAIRFLSAEPLLGPVDLDCPSIDWMKFPEGHGIVGDRLRYDWVIAGGESGPQARPMHPDWARQLRDQCARAGVPFFFKQWGEWAPAPEPLPKESDEYKAHKARGARDLMLVHPDLAAMELVGKKRAGRLLDGITYDGMPGRPA